MEMKSEAMDYMKTETVPDYQEYKPCSLGYTPGNSTQSTDSTELKPELLELKSKQPTFDVGIIQQYYRGSTAPRKPQDNFEPDACAPQSGLIYNAIVLGSGSSESGKFPTKMNLGFDESDSTNNAVISGVTSLNTIDDSRYLERKPILEPEHQSDVLEVMLHSCTNMDEHSSVTHSKVIGGSIVDQKAAKYIVDMTADDQKLMSLSSYTCSNVCDTSVTASNVKIETDHAGIVPNVASRADHAVIASFATRKCIASVLAEKGDCVEGQGKVVISRSEVVPCAETYTREERANEVTDLSSVSKICVEKFKLKNCYVLLKDCKSLVCNIEENTGECTEKINKQARFHAECPVTADHVMDGFIPHQSDSPKLSQTEFPISSYPYHGCGTGSSEGNVEAGEFENIVGVGWDTSTHGNREVSEIAPDLAMSFRITQNVKVERNARGSGKGYKCSMVDSSSAYLTGHEGPDKDEKPDVCFFSNNKDASKDSKKYSENDLNTGSFCEKRFSGEGSSQSGGKPFPCSYNENRFVRKSSCDLHRRKQPREKRHKCPLCGFRFMMKSRLIRHMKTHTGEKPFTCTLCDYSCSEKYLLIQHERKHSGEKPYSCSHCGERFMCKSYLNRHKITHTGEKPHECSVCEKRFARKDGLLNHMRTHTGEKPKTCPYCNFRTAHKLITHFRIHHMDIIQKSVSKFDPRKTTKMCSHCGKVFTCNNLDKHILTHSGAKPYTCLLCDKRFARKDCLVVHMKVHTGEKPHKCLMCDKRFTRKDLLTVHMRIHTGEKPYACSHCDYRSTNKTGLIAHTRTHTGEKPHQCPLCEFGTSSKQHLFVHLRKHTGEKPYPCSLCDQRFIFERELKVHKIKIHNAN